MSQNARVIGACFRDLSNLRVCVAAALTLLGCGLNVEDPTVVNPDGGAMSATASGLGRTLTLGSLTTEQTSALCDWTNTKQGGYGRQVACSDGTSKATNATNLACVNQTRSIGIACSTLSVGDVEDCANAVGTDLCTVSTAGACAAVRACGP